MDRREIVLTVLTAGKGRAFSPAQIQKAVFLVDKNLPRLVDRGGGFNFVPYNYGPFDRDVYSEADNLQRDGAAIISPSSNGRWMTYAASDLGIKRGEKLLAQMSVKNRRYVESVAEWVLAQSFGSLVKSIYDLYPKMRANSIFQD